MKVELLVLHPHDGLYAGDSLSLEREEYLARKGTQPFPYYHVVSDPGAADELAARTMDQVTELALEKEAGEVLAPKAEELKAEEPKAEEPKVEEPKAEEPKAEAAPETSSKKKKTE